MNQAVCYVGLYRGLNGKNGVNVYTIRRQLGQFYPLCLGKPMYIIDMPHSLAGNLNLTEILIGVNFHQPQCVLSVSPNKETYDFE